MCVCDVMMHSLLVQFVLTKLLQHFERRKALSESIEIKLRLLDENRVRVDHELLSILIDNQINHLTIAIIILSLQSAHISYSS